MVEPDQEKNGPWNMDEGIGAVYPDQQGRVRKKIVLGW
jgi:hypothetical protein